MANVFVSYEEPDSIRLTNDTGADLDTLDFTVIGGVACICTEPEGIENGEIGSFLTQENVTLQINEFVTSEDTFGTVNAKVYWDPTSGDFSDTETAGYYYIGRVKTVKDSNGMVVINKNFDAVLIPSTTVAFVKTATLTSAAAATGVEVLADADVPAGKTAYVTGMILTVDGSTAWTDATGTIVTLQDTEASPVVGVTIAKAGLTDSAVLDLLTANVTLGDAVALGEGFTAAAGLVLIGDADFGAGSDLVVTISGYVK